MARHSIHPRYNKWYGWKPDLPDKRDHVFLPTAARLPSKVDLRNAWTPPVYDQENLGACTGNAIAALVEYERRQQGLADYTPSRLFIYYLERMIEGTINEDSGAMIRDGMSVVHKYGAPNEKLWPYIIDRFARKPSQAAFKAALLDLVDEYSRVTSGTITGMKHSLAQGKPVVFGFTVYESFESSTVARTGVVPMPRRGEQVLGGHAVAAWGYNDTTSRILVRNSWGADWGLKGYFTMPYAYVSDGDLADDFWNVSKIA